MVDPSRAVKLSSAATRTRRDIVAAAIVCWSVDNTASLGRIAEQAGVGRTTLNRYFSSREQLIVAVDDECRLQFVAAVERSRPEEDVGLAALQRVCAEIIGLGPVLGLIFADNAVVDPDNWSGGDSSNGEEPSGDEPRGEGQPDAGSDSDPFEALVARGLVDGSIAADLPPAWLVTVVWTSLYAAWLAVSSGACTAHEAAQLCGRTLAGGIAG